MAYIAIQKNVKYQNNQNNMITLREKEELHKRGRLDHKNRGKIFAMHSEFRYHSENCRHSENLNFRYAQ